VISGLIARRTCGLVHSVERKFLSRGICGGLSSDISTSFEIWIVKKRVREGRMLPRTQNTSNQLTLIYLRFLHTSRTLHTSYLGYSSFYHVHSLLRWLQVLQFFFNLSWSSSSPTLSSNSSNCPKEMSNNVYPNIRTSSRNLHVRFPNKNTYAHPTPSLQYPSIARMGNHDERDPTIVGRAKVGAR